MAAMTNLTQNEKDKFLREHLRHRLTLLRTLRERKKGGHSYQYQGDIYRCVKDSNLNAVRLILDFLGLKGKFDGSDYELISSQRKQSQKFLDDDVKIDQFIGQLLVPANVPTPLHRVLAGVYKRADKELAHVTSTFNDEFNQEDVLIEAATAVEDLLQKFLYAPLGEQLPEMDA
jgi:hypothetical protein